MLREMIFFQWLEEKKKKWFNNSNIDQVKKRKRRTTNWWNCTDVCCLFEGQLTPLWMGHKCSERWYTQQDTCFSNDCQLVCDTWQWTKCQPSNTPCTTDWIELKNEFHLEFLVSIYLGQCLERERLCSKVPSMTDSLNKIKKNSDETDVHDLNVLCLCVCVSIAKLFNE